MQRGPKKPFRCQEVGVNSARRSLQGFENCRDYLWDNSLSRARLPSRHKYLQSRLPKIIHACEVDYPEKAVC